MSLTTYQIAVLDSSGLSSHLSRRIDMQQTILELSSEGTWRLFNPSDGHIAKGFLSEIVGCKKVSFEVFTNTAEITFAGRDGKFKLKVGDPPIQFWNHSKERTKLPASSAHIYFRVNKALSELQATSRGLQPQKALTVADYHGNEIEFSAIYLGGYGLASAFEPGIRVAVTLDSEALNLDKSVIPWTSFTTFTTGGPGLFTTGGGWSGGGFGIAGALKGAAWADFMNAITTEHHIETSLRLTFENAEVNLVLTSDYTPETLDIALAPLRGLVRNTNISRLVGASQDTKECPDCAETIKLAALKCRYCDYRFDV